MPTYEEVKELIKRQKERADINKLINVKAVSGARVAALLQLDPELGGGHHAGHRSHDPNERGPLDPLDRFGRPTDGAPALERENKNGLDSNITYQISVIKEINEHHARLRELSAYLAASLVVDKSDDEIVQIVNQSTDPRIPFPSSSSGNGLASGLGLGSGRSPSGNGNGGVNDEVPKELYLPRAFEALRRDLITGGRVSKSIGEQDAGRLLNVITDAMKSHGVKIKELVGGVWVEGSGVGRGAGDLDGEMSTGMGMNIGLDVDEGHHGHRSSLGQDALTTTASTPLRRARYVQGPSGPRVHRDPGYKNRRVE